MEDYDFKLKTHPQQTPKKFPKSGQDLIFKNGSKPVLTRNIYLRFTLDDTIENLTTQPTSNP
jgi:hypothetical protein